MNTTPYIIGYRNSDEAVICDDTTKAIDYIVDLIEEGEDPDNIVIYKAQMVTLNIELKQTATVTLKP